MDAAQFRLMQLKKRKADKKVHKVNRWTEALCRSYKMGWVVPSPGHHSRSWARVTCGSCLKRK